MPSPRLAVWVVVGLWAGPAWAAPVELLSHRAAYRLSLASSQSGGFSSVRGALVMEWRASCEGWLSNQQLGFVAQPDEGDPTSYDVRFSSWESLDNTQLRFNIRAFDDGEIAEEYRGDAVLAGLNGAGMARYEIPEPRELQLPTGTIFPTEHIRRLIAAARMEQTVVAHEVFDGSGPEALTRVTAVIGQPRTDALPIKEVARTRWPISLAYYDPQENDATPQFELSFDLAENGVLSNVTLDYGEFSLNAKLEEVQTYPAPSCE
jgi:hypothetical protein